MSRFLIFIVIGISLQASAQRSCATATYTDQARRANPAFAATATAINAFIKQQSRNYLTGMAGRRAGSPVAGVIRIPVVVHVLYNNAVENISDAKIRSGIAALNRDFRRQNSDTVNTPQRFKGAAADMEIEFHLATADPHGVATTGIVRKQAGAPAFDLDDKIKQTATGGDAAWDTKSYLNIWIGNTRRLLGYATMPGTDTLLDGVVINYTAFGTINVGQPYHLGRTAVHEVGHWLGLYHIWGDAACGDDEVDDTPAQAGYTTGCPTAFRSSCSNAPDGDMYMNYMDFTNDACMNLFTQGQKARMRALFAAGGPRASMLASTGLHAPWVEESPWPDGDSVAVAPLLRLYPNPATHAVTAQFREAETYSGQLYLLNTTGHTVRKFVVASATLHLNLSGLAAGVYFLQGSVNGNPVHQKLIKAP